MSELILGKHDEQIAKVINNFLPERLFDAHMHVSHVGFESVRVDTSIIDLDRYYKDMYALLGNREYTCNAIVYPHYALKNKEELKKSVDFLTGQLESHKGSVGEITVMPNDTPEDIERQIIHPQIRGLKCYWIFSESGAGAQSDIKDYLPEAAWEVANKRKMYITLHMVKDKALADNTNREYIKTMAKKYPDAILILAHCARSFASWTVFDTVDELVDLENIYFDFSGICESPNMAYIIKKAGIKRCMWGTDYPISNFIGRAISFGNSFFWLAEDVLDSINGIKSMPVWRVGVENVMAFRQAAKLMDLTPSDIEDYFYNNAKNLFYR